MSKNEMVEIAAELVHETDAAYLIDDGSGEKIWLPKSQVEHDEDAGVFLVPEWLAMKKDLI